MPKGNTGETDSVLDKEEDVDVTSPSVKRLRGVTPLSNSRSHERDSCLDEEDLLSEDKFANKNAKDWGGYDDDKLMRLLIRDCEQYDVDTYVRNNIDNENDPSPSPRAPKVEFTASSLHGFKHRLNPLKDFLWRRCMQHIVECYIKRLKNPQNH